jgi:hypothetical protein
MGMYIGTVFVVLTLHVAILLKRYTQEVRFLAIESLHKCHFPHDCQQMCLRSVAKAPAPFGSRRDITSPAWVCHGLRWQHGTRFCCRAGVYRKNDCRIFGCQLVVQCCSKGSRGLTIHLASSPAKYLTAAPISHAVPSVLRILLLFRASRAESDIPDAYIIGV